MSDTLHHTHLTPTQQGAVSRRMRFLADINAKAYKPKVIPIVCIDKVQPVPVVEDSEYGPRIKSEDELAFGPIIHKREPEPKHPGIKLIIRIVAGFYELSVTDLISARRTAVIVRPRQVAMYLSKTLTLKSLPEIGRQFGWRDHTTVLHAVRKIEGLVRMDDRLADEIEVLKLHIRQAVLNGTV